ncbi:hypothetical protein V1522DRAFT_460638 [Lipomyces starkeyi]
MYFDHRLSLCFPRNSHFAPFVSPAVLNGTQRLNSSNELAEDITPGGFTVVAFSPTSPDTPIATASVKVYYNKFWEDWGDARRLKLKQWKEENKDAVHTQWEITAVAVLAEELNRRLLASQKQTDGELKTMVRGFVLVEETMIPAGILGNLTELTNWDMEKTLRLDDY